MPVSFFFVSNLFWFGFNLISFCFGFDFVSVSIRICFGAIFRFGFGFAAFRVDWIRVDFFISLPEAFTEPEPGSEPQSGYRS